MIRFIAEMLRRKEPNKADPRPTRSGDEGAGCSNRKTKNKIVMTDQRLKHELIKFGQAVEKRAFIGTLTEDAEIKEAKDIFRDAVKEYFENTFGIIPHKNEILRIEREIFE